MKFAAAVICLLATSLTSTAFASGAVDYTCAGFIPSHGQGVGLSKAAVSFQFTSAPSSESSATILLRTDRYSQKAPVELNLNAKDCEVTMSPEDGLVAYRVTIKGTCGSNEKQDIVGVCFFN